MVGFSDKSLRRAIVLVTGASPGIAKATALAFAAEGADLALISCNAERLVRTQSCSCRRTTHLSLIGHAPGSPRRASPCRPFFSRRWQPEASSGRRKTRSRAAGRLANHQSRQPPTAEHCGFLAKKGCPIQQSQDDRKPGTPDNLWQSVRRDFGTHGRFDTTAKVTSLHLWIITHRALILALGAGVALALLFFGRGGTRSMTQDELKERVRDVMLDKVKEGYSPLLGAHYCYAYRLKSAISFNGSGTLVFMYLSCAPLVSSSLPSATCEVSFGNRRTKDS
jgi:NAD(P)-dependent dehydrogenase (short-subunit alcohol dehydrogenase family)